MFLNDFNCHFITQQLPWRSEQAHRSLVFQMSLQPTINKLMGELSMEIKYSFSVYPTLSTQQGR